MAKLTTFICSLRAALQKSIPVNRQLRERADLRRPVMYRDGFVYVRLPDDFSVDGANLQIYELEYIGWEKPRRYIAFPAGQD